MQPADIAEQGHRELELLRRQLDFGAVPADLAALDVDLEGREGQLLVFLARIGAAKQRVDAREQLLAAHRLDHVVVGAVLEREHDVLLRIAHRDEQDRDALRDIGPQPLAALRRPETSGTCQSSMNRSKLSRPACFMASRPSV